MLFQEFRDLAFQQSESSWVSRFMIFAICRTWHESTKLRKDRLRKPTVPEDLTISGPLIFQFRSLGLAHVICFCWCSPELPYPGFKIRDPSSPAAQHSITPAFQRSSCPAFLKPVGGQQSSSPAFQHFSSPAFQHSSSPEFQYPGLGTPVSRVQEIGSPARQQSKSSWVSFFGISRLCR